jgi:HSP20 family protein
MAIVKYDPFDLRSFWRWPSVWEEEETEFGGQQLDVYETDDEIVIKAGVAGVDPKNVDLTFEDGILQIQGQEEEEEKKGKKYYKKSSRSYRYRVAVPGNVDLKEEPEAEVEKGVISITFKKAEEAKPKKIAVKGKSK